MKEIIRAIKNYYSSIPKDVPEPDKQQICDVHNVKYFTGLNCHKCWSQRVTAWRKVTRKVSHLKNKIYRQNIINCG